MARAVAWRKGEAATWLGLALIFIAIYARVLGYDFVWDDEIWYQKSGAFDRPLLDGLTRSIFDLIEVGADRAAHESYRPLWYVSAWADRHLLGGTARAAHFQSLLWACLYLPLGYFWGRAFKWSPAQSIVTAALFLLHPLQAEVFAYVSGRPDLMASVFAVTATWLTLLRPIRDRRWEGLRLFLVLALFMSSLLSKEGAIGLPLACLILALAHGRLSERWTALIALGAALILYGVLRVALFTTPPREMPIEQAIVELPGMALELLLSVAWPTDLAISRTPDSDFILVGWGLLSVSLVAFAWLVLSGARRRLSNWHHALLWLIAAWLCFVVLIGPNAVVAVHMDALSDRYGHLASFFLFVCLSQSLSFAWASASQVRIAPLLGVGILGVLFASMVVLTWVQVGSWATALSVYARALVVEPHNAHANYRLGAAFLNLGELRLAEERFSAALRLSPNDHKYWNDLGGVQMELGRYDDAGTSFRQSVRLSAGAQPGPFINLALLAAEHEKDAKRACDIVTIAHKRFPFDAKVREFRSKLCAQ